MITSLTFCRPHTTSLFTSRLLSPSSRIPSQPSNCPAIRCCSTNNNVTIPKRKRVGLVVIGNEILNGKTIDKNLGTLAKHVESHGAILQKAVTIRDDIQIIAKHVNEMSNEHDLVFTSGGIGPTVDDVSYQGVATAFNLPLVQHEETITKMKQNNMDLNAARLRMATLPKDCHVIWTDDLWVPLAVINNVYILPGIPTLFQKMLTSVPSSHFGNFNRRVKINVLCDMAEGDLAHLLENVSVQFQHLDLGSYPATTNEARIRYRTMITLEGDNDDEVSQAAEIIKVGVNGRYEKQDVQ